jgi:hypothetical protein
MNRREILKGAVGVCLLTTANVAFAAKSNDVQRCENNVCLDRKFEADGHDFTLQGMATLRWWGFQVYTAGYYLGVPKQVAEGIAPARQLTLHYHRGIEKKDFVCSTGKLMVRNPNVDMEALRPQLDKLYAQYENVKSGDRYILRHVPAIGTRLGLNGAFKEAIPGDDFADAMFGIWTSTYSTRNDFRRRLTGERPE